MSKRKSKNKPKFYIDEFGVTHLQIERSKRNLMHWEIQLRNRAQVVESKKHKKPKHKKKIYEEE